MLANKTLVLLIVDDNPQMRRLIRSVVSDMAESIAECCDGALALGAYAEQRPDWVLMDIRMPEMDGITATRGIKASYPEAHVCIVTEYDDDELRQTAREAGAEGYVVKEDLLKLRQMLAVAAEGPVSCAADKEPSPDSSSLRQKSIWGGQLLKGALSCES